MFALVVLLQAITFGPLGPMQHMSAAAGAVRVTVDYRIAPDRYHDTGENAVPPSIAEGRLSIVAGPRRYVYDLASVLPIHRRRVLLPTSGRNDCGATRALTIQDGYVAIEWILAEKGCRPVVTFIDLSSGRIAQITDLDHRWNHRLDVVPVPFRGTRIRVDRVDRVVLAAAVWNGPGKVPWPFIIVHGHDAAVHGHDAAGRQRLYSFEVPRFRPDGTLDPGRTIVPTPGTDVQVGDFGGTPYLFAYHPDPLVLRLDQAEDARYALMQPPTTRRLQRMIQGNEWAEVADVRASRGQMDAALAAYAKMLHYEDDAGLRAGEERALRQCRAIARDSREKRITKRTASRLWSQHC